MTISIGIKDLNRIGRAIVTNLIARFSPRAYLCMTGETGRGLGEESADDVVEYIRGCFEDYFEKLEIVTEQIEQFLAGKCILEYGPGDVPGVAILMLAHGAKSVVCVDRFPLMNNKPKNMQIVKSLMETLTPEQSRRIQDCLVKPDDYASGWRRERLRYLTSARGLSGVRNEIDLIYSRAVLEHVNDLEETFADMSAALKRDGVAIHLVDLKSHGLHRVNKLDFLVWPVWLWNLMYGYKGVPNRWRVDKYRSIVRGRDFDVQLMEPTLLADANDILEVKPFLAAPFQKVAEQDLSWLGFWLVFTKKNGSI